MNFTSRDMSILVASFLMIVFVTMTFPALGLTDGSQVNETDQSDVPDLDVSMSTVQFMGERPAYPRSPTSGELRYNPARTAGKWSVDIQREPDSDGDGFNDYVVFLQTFCLNDDPANESCEITLSEFVEGSQIASHQINLTESFFSENQVKQLETSNYSVNIEGLYADNWNTSDLEYGLRWEVMDSPDSDSFLASIPLVGGVWGAGEQLVSILAWGFQTFFWFSGWLVELALNAIALIIGAFLFLFALASYIAGVQLDIVTAAPQTVGLILMGAYILLLAEGAKITLIIISVLPTT